MPVIESTHDVGPSLQVFHTVGRASDHQASTERILNQAPPAGAGPSATRRSRRHCTTCARLRSEPRGYGFFSRGPDRKAAEEYAAAKVAVTCQQAGLPLPSRSIGQMGSKEFEQLLAALPRGPLRP